MWPMGLGLPQCRASRCSISLRTRSVMASRSARVRASWRCAPGATAMCSSCRWPTTERGSASAGRRRPAAACPRRASACAGFTAAARHSTSVRAPEAGRWRGCVYPIARSRGTQTMANAEWRVVVADDEPAARRGVRQLLAEFPEFTVVGECRDGGEVLTALDTQAPDVLFLDIQMPGIGGLEVIRRRTPERMPAVVFLTAYDQFALQAFEAQ